MWADDAVAEGVLTEEERDIVYVVDAPDLVEFAPEHCAETVSVAASCRGYDLPLNIA